VMCVRAPWCVTCTRQIRTALETSGVPATVPMVIPNMVTSRVLVMQFISGYKLNEFGTLRRLGADLRELTRIVCDAVAYQMCVVCPHVTLWGRVCRCPLAIQSKGGGTLCPLVCEHVLGTMVSCTCVLARAEVSRCRCPQ
jgi:hypothetical protein